MSQLQFDSEGRVIVPHSCCLEEHEDVCSDCGRTREQIESEESE